MRTVRLPTRGDVEAALERVRPHLAPTPVVESEGFALKHESLQPTGSLGSAASRPPSSSTAPTTTTPSATRCRFPDATSRRTTTPT